MPKNFIVRIEAYRGDSSAINLWTEEAGDKVREMFCVGTLDKYDVIELVDCGYNSMDELVEAWPELAYDYGYLSADSVPLKGKDD